MDALHIYEAEYADKFKCELVATNEGVEIADKKYPLHLVGREQKIHIAMRNTGPGTALSVKAVLTCDSDLVNIKNYIESGDIPSGDFVFSFDMSVVEPIEKIDLTIDFSWWVAHSNTEQKLSLKVKILAQDKTINWKSIEHENPYSTEAAEGEGFVGRKTNIMELVSRTRQNKIESSYIHGQKRIGKTSLAKAVMARIQKTDETSHIKCLYCEWGEFARVDPQIALEALGNRICDFLIDELPDEFKEKEYNFLGTLAPLNDVLTSLSRYANHLRFLITIDEFDEIPESLYRFGALAETFFSNLRAISSKENIAFMLVGGERMRFIMQAQGDQLNKFTSVNLGYFLNEEYQDFENLVIKPTKKSLTWKDDAIRKLFEVTNGHAYYTNLIASKIFTDAVKNKDAHISRRDVERVIDNTIQYLDVNSFSHFWKDGIQEDSERTETIALNRGRILVAIGRVTRLGLPKTIHNIGEKNFSPEVKYEIRSIVDDFLRREILTEEKDSINFKIPFFGLWVKEKGVNTIVEDKLGDDLAKKNQKIEDDAYVKSDEITAVVEKWPTYKGRQITTDLVRKWLGQVENNRERRLLFTLLQNIRFFTELEIREKLELIHKNTTVDTISEFTWDSRSGEKKRQQKRKTRRDILITYLDGEAKSGQYYAAKYADQNGIYSECVFNSEEFEKKAQEHERKNQITIKSVVIIDDLAGTGNTVISCLKEFFKHNLSFLKERSAKVIVGILASTIEGELEINNFINENDIEENIVIRFAETLHPKNYAFNPEHSIWLNETDMYEAKSLLLDIGSKLVKNNPLGYKQQGLLLVFPDRCPNNSIPILHKSQTEGFKWKALFERSIKG